MKMKSRRLIIWKAFFFAMSAFWFFGGINYLLKDDLVGAAIYLSCAFIWLFIAIFGKFGFKK